MHIFLTGPKQVGKTTLLNAILDGFSGKVAGFRTVRLNTYLPGTFTVHLLPIEGDQSPTEENLLFYCTALAEDSVIRFDRLGCEALEQSVGADLLVMDELGPHEVTATGFQSAVRKALEGDTPILGVLQQADVTFLKEIAQHPHVMILSVTQENREALASRIPEYLAILQRKAV